MKLDLNKFEVCSSTVMQEQTLSMHIGCAWNVMVDARFFVEYLFLGQNQAAGWLQNQTKNKHPYTYALKWPRIQKS